MRNLLRTNRLRPLWVLVGLLWSLSATAQTATIRGKVVDANTNDPLPGASVMLVGSTNGAATNLQGEFIIQNVRPGTQSIKFSYIGFEEITQNITVEGGKSANFGIVKLSPTSRSLDGVTVRAALEGQQKALNQQRTSDNIKNIISADLIGRFPDLNVAEALQRVPGINIERDRGEGGVVQMRGAPAGFTTVNINGEQIPSTQSGGERNQELSVIPVDQLSSMEVTKAITPDLDGDNIGGTIDLKTPTAKNLKARGKLELGGGYNNIVQKTNFIGRASYNQRFFASDNVPDGRLGISAGYSYFETTNGRDRVQYQYPNAYSPVRVGSEVRNDVLPTFYRLRDLRTRTGISGTLDYKFNEKSQLTFNYMYTQRFDEDREKRAQFDIGAGTTAAPTWSVVDGVYRNSSINLRRFVNPRQFDVKTHTFTLNGNHSIGKVLVDYVGFMSNAANRNDAGRTYDFRSGGVRTFGGDFDGFGTDFLNIVGRENVDVHDPFQVNTFRGFQDRADLIDARNLSAKINVTIPYLLGGNNAIFKFGGKIRQITNNRDREFSEFDYTNRGFTNEGALFASLISSEEDQQFFLNRVRFGPTLDAGRTDAFIARAFAERPDVFQFDQINLLNQRSAWFYRAKEDVQAAYAMTRVNVGKLMVLAGLRFENTTVNNTTASLVLRSPTTNRDTVFNRDATTRVNYSFLLPNVHLKYSLNNLTNLRFAFTTSFARPNFTAIMPRVNENPANQTVDLGNPDLQPPRSINLDLLFERYLSNVGILSGGLFYKRINNFIFTRGFTQDRPVRELDPATGQFRDVIRPFTAQQPQNGDAADLFGFEANLQTDLSALGTWGKGIGVFINYTFTSSNANTFERKNIRLPGQAMHTANFALSYEYKKFTVRGMFNYNGAVVRELGPDVVTFNGQSIATNGDFDQWRDNRYQLDLSASYNLGRGFRVYSEFINLTNRPEKEYFGAIGKRSRPLNLEYFDWWNRFGVSYSF
jgi:TonB-dependent receptor